MKTLIASLIVFSSLSFAGLDRNISISKLKYEHLKQCGDFKSEYDSSMNRLNYPKDYFTKIGCHESLLQAITELSSQCLITSNDQVSFDLVTKELDKKCDELFPKESSRTLSEKYANLHCKDAARESLATFSSKSLENAIHNEYVEMRLLEEKLKSNYKKNKKSNWRNF